MPAPVEGSIDHYFSQDAARVCAEEIAEAQGVEVFFICRRNEAGLITEVESHAFGTKNCVPALMQLAQPGEVVVHNHPSGQLIPSDADIDIASHLGNMGVGSFIIDNQAHRCRIIVKPQDPKKKKRVSEESVVKRLSPKSDLSNIVDDFEDRPQQRSMASQVVSALNDDGISVIEAGTGTGKSFAYLVPAIIFALENGERVVISTNTINLQEQLLHKDIPALRKAIGRDFSVEIVKGRSNYVCKRKAQFAESENSLILDDFQKELKDALAWAGSSSTGDLQELAVPPRREVWERLQSESDNTLRVRCPFYEECFFYNSRRRAARANLLIVNHSLLLSDLAIRRATGNYTTAAVLPPYQYVVIDEAHNLEESAARNLAQQVSRFGVRQLFGRLYKRDKKEGKGVYASLTVACEEAVSKGFINSGHPMIQKLVQELIPRVSDIRDSLDFLLQDFINQFLRLTDHAFSNDSMESQKIRLTWKLKQHPIWDEECEGILQGFSREISAFVDENQKVFDLSQDIDDEAMRILTNPLLEWKSLIGRLDSLRQTVLRFLSEDNENCRWIEIVPKLKEKREAVVKLCLSPVDVREILRESLHDKMKAEVLTSATLTVDQKFDFFKERTGLPSVSVSSEAPVEYDEEGLPVHRLEPVEARPVSMNTLGAVFDYSEQVFFGVPKDLPDPREKEFEQELAELINRSVVITGGRAFVLFTSYGQLNRVYNLCAPVIQRIGVRCLKQGSENRDALLRRFREDETSVLFATSSFWEGVDVKGRALELLIIAKLPFSVPTEPVQEAQFEALKAKGRDPFQNLVIPRAIIRFKQGFGRLIRSRTDRGAVIIADNRVVKANYGRRFIRSLPDIQVRAAQSEELLKQMEEFFEKSPTGKY